MMYAEQVFGKPIIGYPVLDEHLYTSCFGMRLEGYVLVRQNKAMTFQGSKKNPAMYHRYR